MMQRSNPRAIRSRLIATQCLPALMIATFLILLASVSIAAGEWKGETVEKGGVSQVMNPAAPMEATAVVGVEELWRLGGETDSDEEFFGVIGTVLEGPDGTVYLLDQQLAEIKIFTGTGDYVRTIGREGEGPGEFRRPGGMIFTPDGNLGVLQMMGGGIVLLSPEGDPAGQLPLPVDEGGGRRFVVGGRNGGGNLVLLSMRRSFGEGKVSRTSIISSIGWDGSELVRYFESTGEMDFAKPVVDEREGLRPNWAVGPDGRVYAVTTFGAYEIHVWSADGKPLHTIHREFEHLARSAQEIDGLKSRIVIRGPIDPEIIIADDHPDVEEIYPRKDGTIWVKTSRTSREADEGSLGSYDIFDAEGRFTRQVEIRAGGDAENDAFFFSEDRLYVVTSYRQAMMSMFGGRGEGGAEEIDEDLIPMELICYRLDLGGLN